MSVIERTILQQLINDEEFSRKVLPFLKDEYFSDSTDKVIYQQIALFFDKYNKLPNKDILSIEVSNRKDLTEDVFMESVKCIDSFDETVQDRDWLLDETESFCKNKAIYNAILSSVQIIEGNDKKNNVDYIPMLLQEALAVGFDSKLGHDFLENADERWEFYHQKDERRIPFDLTIMNKITGGGVKRKTLSAVIAPTGVGKTIFLCHFAAYALLMGFNGVYITMEMGEEEIAERIDANTLKLMMNDVANIDKVTYLAKIDEIKKKTSGKLMVKEYPSGVHAGHFRAYLEELRTKKDFKVDFIIIDYLTICGSQKFKSMTGVNTNTYYRQVSEELRNLVKEYDAVGFTAVQPNRDGQENSDIDITNIAEAIGITSTLDLFFAIMAPEELIERNQYLFKQIKNRYGDINYYKKFVMGIDKARMTFFDVENATQDKIDGKGKVDLNTGEILTSNKKDFSTFKF